MQQRPKPISSGAFAVARAQQAKSWELRAAMTMNTLTKIAAAGLIGLAVVPSARAAGWLDINKAVERVVPPLPPQPDKTDCFPHRIPPEIICPHTDDGCKRPAAGGSDVSNP